MLTDTHCHFSYLGERGIPLPALLEALCNASVCEDPQREATRGEGFAFLLDAGTRSKDLAERKRLMGEAFEALSTPELRDYARSIFYYSAGVWPDAGAIRNRFEEIAALEASITESPERVVALGECGLDHHWNPSGVDGRREEDFAGGMVQAEAEFFEMQLCLAKKRSLPVVVHSRDAFDGTISCIKNVGYHHGEIHCFGYGIGEARAFLDLGWYIALGGGVTYTKRSRLEEMTALIRYIPQDRLLMETDAPYLAPVPHRGETNTPLFITHVYDYVAEKRGIERTELETLALANARRLFL